MRTIRTVAAGLVALIVISACTAPRSGGDVAGGMQTFAARPGQPTVPKGVLFGMSTYPDDYGTIAERNANWQMRTDQLGRPYDIANFFYTWDKPFPTQEEQLAINRGSTPMVSWNGTDTGVINSGQQDGLIRQRADALRDLHVPVFLRFFWEMDGHKGDQLAGGNPANFIAAWRRVHAIFEQEGATNISWVWAPTNLRFGPSNDTAPNWYPGDDVVDWIGCDGYNWAPVYNGYPYDQFDSIFANFYAWAGSHNKPIMIAETGAMERNPGEKSAWMRNMATTLKTRYTNIRAVVYWDQTWVSGGYTFPFKVDTSADSLSTWRALAADPYFNTRGR